MQAVKTGYQDGERRLLLAFVGLSVLDAGLTTVLARHGFLWAEVSPIMRWVLRPSITWSFVEAIGLFWVVKLGLTLLATLAISRLADLAPGIRRVVFILPVVVMSAVCIVGIIGVIS